MDHPRWTLAISDQALTIVKINMLQKLKRSGKNVGTKNFTF